MHAQGAQFRSGFRSRSSGILMHVTSLPGRHGSGDLGEPSHRFVEWLHRAGQSWWQVLPVGPPGRGPGWSPYDSASAFAGNPGLVSLDELTSQGLLAARDLLPRPRLATHRVDYVATLGFRESQLRQAFSGFRRARRERRSDFRDFCDANADWLEDYALFMALRREHDGKPWTEWADEMRNRVPSALRAASERLADEVAAHRFVQFEFDRQWQALREHAHRLGVGLIGDLPIFVTHDSADVWCHQRLFELDRDGRPLRVTGYPPDRFNRNGQCWGHPQYRWANHERDGFAWWVRRFERIFELFDALRIDHFLGFTRTWSIPTAASSPRQGRWVRSPGEKLLAAVRRQLGDRPMIAEDLGHVTPADIRLRDKFGLAPMRILQFGFGDEVGSAEHLPHNYDSRCAAYTGNHDNNTTMGWFRELPAARRRWVQTYLGGQAATVHWDSLRALYASPARLVICPAQDLLGLNSGARMNVPGTAEGNWCWRLDRHLPVSTANRLRRLTTLFGRPSAVGAQESLSIG